MSRDTAVRSPQLADPLAEADRLEAAEDLTGAVDALVEANRLQPSFERQVRLIELRAGAARAMAARPSQRSSWPPAFDDPFPHIKGSPPEITASELDASVMAATIAHHGSIIVRGLFDGNAIERTRESIALSHAARVASQTAVDDAYYRPMVGLDGELARLRRYVENKGGIWLADSPAATAQVLADLWASGALGAIADHFGERPVFSLQKSTLRRSEPVFGYTGWHQDGSFLGTDVRTVNVWVSLSACGGERPAPGLEVVPRRVEQILPLDETDAKVAINGWDVYAAADDTPVTRPEFDPGDALMFDEKMIHRTFLSKTMTEPRLALECWLFAPAFLADEYVPLLA